MNDSLQYLPKNFQEEVFVKRYYIPLSKEAVFRFLCNPRTFTAGSTPLSWVEFINANGEKVGFDEGAQSLHSGLGFSFAGQIETVVPNFYRDIKYYYGSYIFSMALIRPVRIEFWFKDDIPSRSMFLDLRFTTYTRRFIGPLYRLLIAVFWKQFGWNLKILSLFLPRVIQNETSK